METFNCNDNAHQFTLSRMALHFFRAIVMCSTLSRYPLFRTEQDRARSPILLREIPAGEPELYLRLVYSGTWNLTRRPRYEVDRSSDIISEFLERYFLIV